MVGGSFGFMNCARCTKVIRVKSRTGLLMTKTLHKLEDSGATCCFRHFRLVEHKEAIDSYFFFSDSMIPRNVSSSFDYLNDISKRFWLFGGGEISLH